MREILPAVSNVQFLSQRSAPVSSCPEYKDAYEERISATEVLKILTFSNLRLVISCLTLGCGFRIVYIVVSYSYFRHYHCGDEKSSLCDGNKLN